MVDIPVPSWVTLVAVGIIVENLQTWLAFVDPENESLAVKLKKGGVQT
jgi:hypothetical protein